MKQQFSSAPPDRPPFVHGHVLVGPDGAMRTWGSYGSIRLCVRSDDPPRRWAEFLSTDREALRAWCRRFSLTLPITPDAAPVIAEIDALIGNPCD